MKTPHIAQIIFGTAGHVDHGKTSLVIALTSVNTDRHPEERKRGISIDFAVAPYTSKNGITIGIVDIPGHEDFIKNAISGASGVDVVILVVAADDGIMPQTREHLLIAKELGASKIIPVITKIDLADSAHLEQLKIEIEDLIDAHGCNRSETICTSSITNEGIDTLKSLLDETISNYQIPPQAASFRMFVRACFSGKGFGNIVTGIPDSGQIAVDDKLEIISSNSALPHEVIVKRIENYKNLTNKTSQHISSAINIKGVESELLERGAILCTKGVYSTSKSILARINAHAETIKNHAHVTLHCGTLKREVELYFLTVKSINRKDNAIVQIKSTVPIALKAGDRFILRTDTTIAGGIVLSRNGKLPRKSLRAMYAENASLAFSQLKNEGGILISELLTSANLILTSKDLFTYSLGEQTLANSHSLFEIGKNLWLNTYKIETIKRNGRSILERYHRNKPDNAGMHAKLFLTMLSSNSVSIDNVDLKKIESFLRQYLPDVKISDNVLSLSTFSIPLSEKESKELEKIKKIVLSQNFSSKGFLEKELNIELKMLTKLLQILENQKFIRSVQKDIFSVSFLEMLKVSMQENFKCTPFTLAEFRVISGLSRNYAVSLLEHFDSDGFTKREEDKRIIRTKEN